MADESDERPRSVLPPSDPAFQGKIEVAFKDSKCAFPEPLEAPAGAPNVLIIVGDDIGYGHLVRSAGRRVRRPSTASPSRA